MIKLLLLSMLICLGYAAYVKIRYNVSSISESYYKTKGKNYFWLWSVLTSFSLLPCWLEASGENYQFVAFLSTCALIAVGCCPDYKSEHSLWHPLFTCFCGVLAIVWAALAGVVYIPIIMLLCTAGLLIYFKEPLIMQMKGFEHTTSYILNRIGFLYWIEVAAFVSIYLSILIKIL